MTANSNSDTAFVLLNTKFATFTEISDYGTEDFPFSVIASDLNQDGYPDIAVTNFGSNTVSILINTGDGSFTQRVSYGVGEAPRSVFASDFDLDGFNDHAVANSESNTFSVILFGEGKGAVISFINSINSTIDGFTITNGCCLNSLKNHYYTSKGNNENYGNGICCIHYSPKISHCIISGNNAPYGGGIYCEDSSPFIIHCIIKDNLANNKVGGIYCSQDSVPTILNCIFYNNTVKGSRDHITIERLISYTDLHLLRCKGFQDIHIMRYDSIAFRAISAYRFFNKPCGIDTEILIDATLVISLLP